MDLDADAKVKGFLAFGYLLCLVAALASGLFAGAFVYSRLGPAGEYVRSAFLQRVGGGPPPFGGKDKAYILILGIDERRYDPGRSDTVMVACVDVPSSGIRVLSIPRDTRVRIAGTSKYDKVNASMHYGGIEAAKETVSGLLGVPIDYYALTNLEGFRKVVDLVGGVDLDVEKRMRYRDRRGGLIIDLEPGLQHLNGEKAMQYVRFRHDALGDISRVRRQQKFLRAVAKRMFEMSNWPRLPAIVNEMLKAVGTDLSPDDVMWMARLGKNLSDEKIRCATVPGYGDMIGGSSQWIPDAEKLAFLTQQLFDEGVVPRLDAITVEVLNASGEVGAAARAAALLQTRGFRIVSRGDARTQDAKVTRVIDHRAWSGIGTQVCALLGCGKPRTAIDETQQADLTVYVGADFSKGRAGGG